MMVPHPGDAMIICLLLDNSIETRSDRRPQDDDIPTCPKATLIFDMRVLAPQCLPADPVSLGGGQTPFGLRSRAWKQFGDCHDYRRDDWREQIEIPEVIAWIESVSEADASGLLSELYDKEVDRSTGLVDNILKVHSLHPFCQPDVRHVGVVSIPTGRDWNT